MRARVTSAVLFLLVGLAVSISSWENDWESERIEEGHDTKVEESGTSAVTFNISDNNCNSSAGKSVNLEQCVGCGELSRMPEDVLRNFRIEQIKRKILLGLKMTEAPNVTFPLSTLPSPLLEGSIITQAPERLKDDFYARTKQVILLADKDIPNCKTRRRGTVGCFQFNVDSAIIDSSIAFAELYVHKRPHPIKNQTHLFQVFEMDNRPKLRTNEISKLGKMVTRIQTTVIEGWITFDVTNLVIRWSQDRDHDIHRIEVNCATCATNQSSPPVDTSGANMPFIVITTDGDEQRRSRRHADCGFENTGCCREKLVINFTEIGWGDWIIAPETYEAYFCKGDCAANSQFTNTAHYHAAIVKQLMVSNPNRTIEGPCCAPNSFSRLSMIYRDKDNETIVYREDVEDIVVESCACS